MNYFQKRFSPKDVSRQKNNSLQFNRRRKLQFFKKYQKRSLSQRVNKVTNLNSSKREKTYNQPQGTTKQKGFGGAFLKQKVDLKSDQIVVNKFVKLAAKNKVQNAKKRGSIRSWLKEKSDALKVKRKPPLTKKLLKRKFIPPYKLKKQKRKQKQKFQKRFFKLKGFHHRSFFKVPAKNFVNRKGFKRKRQQRKPWWLFAKTIWRKANLVSGSKFRQLDTKKNFFYRRRFRRFWKQRVRWLALRRKWRLNKFKKFKHYCDKIKNYYVSSLTRWHITNKLINFKSELTQVSLLNVFRSWPATTKLNYSNVAKNKEFSNFLFASKALKYSIDALLLHMLVLTNHAHSIILSYLIAQMLARNSPKKKQRAVVYNLRKLQSAVSSNLKRRADSHLSLALLVIKITGKLAGSLRTRNFFMRPRTLPLHTIAHPVEASVAMVNTKYGTFTVRVWKW
jgi:hypothetical protein